MSYTYLVSYIFLNSKGTGNGHAFITRNNIIDTVEKVKNLMDFIKSENNFKEVAIMNFILLDGETTNA